MMPFGEYKDMDDCIAKNQDKDSPGGYCAELHKTITGEYPSEKKSAIGEQDKEFLDMFNKEKKEHPDLSDDVVRKICFDHFKKEGKSCVGAFCDIVMCNCPKNKDVLDWKSDTATLRHIVLTDIPTSSAVSGLSQMHPDYAEAIAEEANKQIARWKAGEDEPILLGKNFDHNLLSIDDISGYYTQFNAKTTPDGSHKYIEGIAHVTDPRAIQAYNEKLVTKFSPRFTATNYEYSPDGKCRIDKMLKFEHIIPTTVPRDRNAFMLELKSALAKTTEHLNNSNAYTPTEVTRMPEPTPETPKVPVKEAKSDVPPVVTPEVVAPKIENKSETITIPPVSTPNTTVTTATETPKPVVDYKSAVEAWKSKGIVTPAEEAGIVAFVSILDQKSFDAFKTLKDKETPKVILNTPSVAVEQKSMTVQEQERGTDASFTDADALKMFPPDVQARWKESKQ